MRQRLHASCWIKGSIAVALEAASFFHPHINYIRSVCIYIILSPFYSYRADKGAALWSRRENHARGGLWGSGGKRLAPGEIELSSGSGVPFRQQITVPCVTVSFLPLWDRFRFALQSTYYRPTCRYLQHSTVHMLSTCWAMQTYSIS